ncbi:MAG: YhdP family protein [Halofilum sp. (in: g-proteobacteria)]
MPRLLRIAHRWFWGTIALSLILTAVLLSAARLALPFAGEYRDQVASYLSDYLEASVTIGRLDVEWHGLGPRLRVEDLEIANPALDDAPARADRAYLALALDWPRPGTWLPLRVNDVVLAGIETRIELDERGRPSMGAIRVGGQSERSPGDLARRIATIGDLAIRDARITLVRAGRDPLVLRDVSMRLRSAGGRYRIAANAELPPDLGGRLHTAFDLRGPPGAPREWAGRGYLRASELNLAAWPGWLRSDANRIRAQGRGEIELWTHWDDGGLQRVQARASGDDLVFAREGQGEAAFSHLDGRFAWTRSDPGWRVDGADITVERAGRRWHSNGFSVAHGDGTEGAPEWRGQVDFARLEDILALARVAPLPASVRAPLTRWTGERDLRGDLSALHFTAGREVAPSVRAAVRDLGWTPGEGVPGLRGLDGVVDWRGDGGRVDFATAEATVRAPRLFRAPLPVADLRGRVEIAREDAGLRLRASRLEAANADVRAAGGAELWWPDTGDARVDLELEVAEGDATAVPRYIPAGVMKPELVEWIDRAFVAGRIDGGEILWRGAISDFPHESDPGTFTADLRVSDVRLDYAPQWPGLLQGDGQVQFAGRSLAISATDARLLGTDIERLSIDIADFADAHLQIHAHAEGPLANLVTVVNESPLEERLGALFRGAHAEGAAALALNANVPLGDPDETRAEGSLQLLGNRFAQPRYGLDLRGLEGPVQFTDASVEIDGLKARLRGEPVSLDARTFPEPAPRLRVGIRGQLGQKALLPGLPAALAERIEGRSAWHLQVRVPLGAGRGDEPIRLRGVSSLVGTGVDLPAPLGKRADERRLLHFDFPMARDGGLEPGRIAYGDRVKAALSLAGRRGQLELAAGDIRLGPEAAMPTPRTGPDEGVRLRGHLAELDLAAWLALLRQTGAANADGAGEMAGLAGADLRIGQVRYRGYGVSDVRVQAEREGANWRIDLGSDQIAGHAQVPAHPGRPAQPVRVRLARLAPLPIETSSPDPRTRAAAIDPAAWPPIDLRIDHLALPIGPIRQFALVTAPLPDGLAVRRLEFSNPDLVLDGRGHWRAGDPAETALTLELRSDDFGAGLAELGFGGALGRGVGRVTADLSWPGVPWAPTLAEIEGQARIGVDDGVFKPVDPGLARVFGPLDLRAMLEYGFQFSEFSGRIDLSGGQAHTDNLTIDGSAGRLRFRGRADLASREYDHTIVFRPELTNSLPLFGALSGGPVAGLTVALVQGVLRNLGADMESAAELTYTLTGPWDDPNVERVITDPDGPDSRPRTTGGGG